MAQDRDTFIIDNQGKGAIQIPTIDSIKKISSDGGGGIESIQPGSDNVTIDNSDPVNPIITVVDEGFDISGTDRQVIGFNDSGEPEVVTLGWKQLSDLPTPPTFSNGVLTGTAFQPDGTALMAFIELDTTGAKSNTIPFYTSTGTLFVQNATNSLHAVNLGQLNTKQDIIVAGTTSQYWRGDKTWQTLNSTAVGLGSVNNTSDVNKPVSTAQATAIALKLDKPTTPVTVTDTSYTRLAILDNVGNSKYFASTGTGNHLMYFTAAGFPKADIMIEDAEITDVDITGALLAVPSATWTAGNGVTTISPANSKVMRVGQYYINPATGIKYECFLTDNQVRRSQGS